MPTVILRSDRTPLEEMVRLCAEALARGEVVALPTDTVYGLAVRADDEAAVQRLFAVKGRPDNNPLPVLLPDIAQLHAAAAEVNPVAEILAQKFWPGALTLVVKKSPVINNLVSAGRDTVGVRVPDHPIARAILAGCEFLVAVSSANRSGEEPAQTGAEVISLFDGQVGIIVDDGACPGGVPSTVVDVSQGGAEVLRAGAITIDEINSAIV